MNKTIKFIIPVIVLIMFIAIIYLMYYSNNKSIFTKPASINPNNRFNMSEKDINKYVLRANAGDAEAAFKLYQYYNFILDDDVKSFYWLEKAANGNNAVALYNIAYLYIYNGKYKNHEKAMYWINRGISIDSKESMKLLEEYKLLQSN